MFLLVYLIAGNQFVKSQVITTDPVFPKIDNSVIIYFDATKGNQGLKDYTGDIYAHTGVITDQSTSSTDWKYEIATWTTNTEKAKLTRISSNLYSLTISPNIKEFYGVPDNEKVLKIAFVFRNSDASKTGREADLSDIFTNVYENGLNLKISAPENNHIVLLEDTIEINAISDLSDSLFLYIDDILITKEPGNLLNYKHVENATGLHNLRVIARNETDTISDSLTFFVRQEVNEFELPSGWVQGINYLSEDSVGLVLFAPHKEFVFVVGDFNNWQLNEIYNMNRTPDSLYYWLSLGGLNPNQEYIFQYYIDGQIKIADPYTEKTSDINDKWISADTYPGLIEYPAEKTSGIASVLQTNQAEYEWKNTSFNCPPNEKLIIYEILIRDFLVNHDYKTLIDTLDYLDSLGITAIELMPVSEFEGNESWGYNPSFYFAPDKYYGPKNDFKAFIDTCHGRGFAVILDMVLNHTYGQSPMVQMYFDPSAGDYGQPSPQNPWYNKQSPNTNYSWGYDFNHESIYTQQFVDSVNRYWMEKYNIDGFRFDFTKGFTNTVGDGWSYDASRITILKRMADKIWEIKPKALLILEHFTTNTEEKELADYGLLIWGNLNGQYTQASLSGTSDLSSASYKYRGWNSPNLVAYMESHDEERIMYKNLTIGPSYSNYNIKDFNTALKRIELIANFFIPIPGPKMIWQFEELGYNISIDYDCRVCNKPIHWEYYDNVSRKKLYDVFKNLNQLKQKYPVFSTNNYSISQEGKAKSINLYNSEMNVVIIGNFDLTSLFVNTNFPKTGYWHEYYSGDSLNITNTQEMILLNAGMYKLYTDVRIKKRDNAVGIDDKNDFIENSLIVYPNPSSGIFYVETNSSLNQMYDLKVFNMNGQAIYSETGRTSEFIEIDISAVTTGLYFYNLVIDKKRYTGKLIKN